jgi:hypothetical protein
MPRYSKEDQLFEFIKNYKSNNGFPPTIREMCKAIKVSSTSTIFYYLNKLENSNKIKKNPNKNRALEIVENNPDLYWIQVNAALAMNRFFRFHVSCDIINDEYMVKMVESVRNNPHCEVLVFTKQYDIVNKYVDSNGALPNNLHLIFSLWDAEWNKGVKNPHNFPTTTVIFKDGTPGAKYDKTCGGNCFECAMTGGGCWDIKSGECLAFYEH